MCLICPSEGMVMVVVVVDGEVDVVCFVERRVIVVVFEVE